MYVSFENGGGSDHGNAAIAIGLPGRQELKFSTRQVQRKPDNPVQNRTSGNQELSCRQPLSMCLLQLLTIR